MKYTTYSANSRHGRALLRQALYIREVDRADTKLLTFDNATLHFFERCRMNCENHDGWEFRFGRSDGTTFASWESDAGTYFITMSGESYLITY